MCKQDNVALLVYNAISLKSETRPDLVSTKAL